MVRHRRRPGGHANSSTRVEALLSQIPAADRDAADRAAEAFKATPADARANEAPLLSQVLELRPGPCDRKSEFRKWKIGLF